MTIVIASWLVGPLILFGIGVVLLVASLVISDSSGGGAYGLDFAGCLPFLGAIACWLMAGGMLLGHWFT